MEPIRILIADDQALIAQSLQIVLETRCPEVKVVGLARDGTEVLEFLRKSRPDVILMDVRMPGMDGVEATKRVHASDPSVKIIVLTTFNDDEYVRGALRNGAVGYLLKDISTDELIAAIKAVHLGGMLMSPNVAVRILDQVDLYQSEVELKKAIDTRQLPQWYFELTHREKEVLQQIRRGASNKDIARILFLAEQTVKNMVSEIYAKIGAHSRSEAKEISNEIYG